MHVIAQSILKGSQNNLNRFMKLALRITIISIFCMLINTVNTLKMTSKLLPTLFLSHGGGPAHLLDFRGSPFQDIDRNSKSATFMRSLKSTIDSYTGSSPISCILVVTAHWEESVFTVDYQSGSKTKLVYDYYGFPQESYAPHLTYPVSTDLKVADRVYDLLKAANIPCAKKDRGYDHGTFIPLKVAFPEATIPVVQLSLKSNLDIADHIRLGEVLRPLRSEGVLIIGSGQITHNLRELGDPYDQPDKRSVEFTNWIKSFFESVTTENYEESKRTLIAADRNIPHFRFSHPRTEHFVPIVVAFAAGFPPASSEVTKEDSEDATCVPFRAVRMYDEVVMGTMAIDSYIFM